MEITTLVFFLLNEIISLIIKNTDIFKSFV